MNPAPIYLPAASAVTPAPLDLGGFFGAGGTMAAVAGYGLTVTGPSASSSSSSSSSTDSWALSDPGFKDFSLPYFPFRARVSILSATLCTSVLKSEFQGNYGGSGLLCGGALQVGRNLPPNDASPVTQLLPVCLDEPTLPHASNLIQHRTAHPPCTPGGGGHVPGRQRRPDDGARRLARRGQPSGLGRPVLELPCCHWRNLFRPPVRVQHIRLHPGRKLCRLAHDQGAVPDIARQPAGKCGINRRCSGYAAAAAAGHAFLLAAERLRNSRLRLGLRVCGGMRRHLCRAERGVSRRPIVLQRQWLVSLCVAGRPLRRLLLVRAQIPGFLAEPPSV